MKTFKHLVKESFKPNLAKVPGSFTAFLEKKSQSGELQKQFGSGYLVEKFMQWLKSGLEKINAHVSDEYLKDFATRLNGKSVHDMQVAYNAALAGEGLSVNANGEE